ncbi:MAG: hypothetical protein AAF492_14920, partial [Verrucomicrobiota bacterium]
AGMPAMKVKPNQWKQVSRADIKAVCLSVARELAPLFPERKFDPIEISRSSNGPIVLYKRGPNNTHRVRLDVDGTYWDQFAYQFAHEFCHILCRYDDDDNQHGWFEESLCETASLFVLRRLTVSWKEKPPYPNWKSYAPAHHNYAEKRIVKARKMTGEGSLKDWYEQHRPTFNTKKYSRTFEHGSALYLLPLFEEKPERWRAVQYINPKPQGKKQTFTEYLDEWREAAPDRYAPFIEKVAGMYGIQLAP